MRIISRKILRLFWERPPYRDSEQALRTWFREVTNDDWASPADVKAKFRSASFLKQNRIVFNIAGNKYRLIVRVNYPYRVVYVRFIGTHVEYDLIDANEV